MELCVHASILVPEDLNIDGIKPWAEDLIAPYRSDGWHLHTCLDGNCYYQDPADTGRLIVSFLKHPGTYEEAEAMYKLLSEPVA